MGLPEYLKGSLGEHLFKSFKKLPKDFVLQINGLTGESQTAEEVLTRSVQVAAGLRKLNVQVEDVVVIASHYSENNFAAIYGTLFQGATPFPIEHNLKQREFEHMFSLSQPKLVMVTENRLSEALNALAAIKMDVPVFVLDGSGPNSRPFDKLLDKSVNVHEFVTSPIERPDQQIAAIVPSSGTTGMPKGVAGSHAAYLYSLYLWDALTPKGPYMMLTPPFWISGFGILQLSIPMGFQKIYLDDTSAENVLQAIHKYKPEWAGLPPITMARVLNHPDLSKYNIESLRSVIIGGSSVPHSTINLSKKLCPYLTLYQAYGATEVTGIITIPFDKEALYLAGKPFPQHNCKVVDPDTGADLGPMQSGEIVFKSPTIMKYYVNNSEATRNAFDENGFYHTGDIGFINENGYINITGRSKELIKVKNHQVAPAELEDVIRGLPGVADVAVVGIPHETEQNHPRALVVKEKGSTLTEQQIIDEVADKLSESKQLFAGAQFVDHIPRNVNGKLLRQQLPNLVVM